MKNLLKKPIVCLCASIITQPIFTGVAASQVESDVESNAVALEEVVVRARYKEENLQDVPASITVFSRNTIESAGIQRADDFIRMTPGVSMVDTAEVGDTQVSIRGMNNYKDTEASFAFVVDGVVMTNPAAFNREYANLEQIEILKGPQGALYGRNASSGAIIVTTRLPGDEPSFDMKVDIAENESYFISSTYSTPIVGDAFAISLHGDYRTTDGFQKNRFYNNDKIVDDFESYNLDARAIWRPSDVTVVDFKARYGHVDATPADFNAAFALPAFAEALDKPLFFEDVNDHNFEYVRNVKGTNYQDAVEFSVKLDHEFENFSLTSWMLYNDIENEWTADGTSAGFGFFFDEPSCRSTTANLFDEGFQLPQPQALGPTPEESIFGPTTPTTCDGYQHQKRDQKDFSFELRIASETDSGIRWGGGVYYLDIKREVGVSQGIDTGGKILENLYNPIGTSSPTEALSWDDYKNEVFAIFGNTDIDLTPTIELSMAIRYDKEDRDVKSLVPVEPRTQYIVFDGGPFIGGAPLNPGLNPAVNPDGVIPPQSNSFDHWQPKVTLTWDVVENATLYSSWGVGFKSGGFNSQGSAATIDLFLNDPLGVDIGVSDDYKKEVANSYEVGFKSRVLEGTASIDGAVYYTEVDNMQFFEFFVGPFGLLRQVNNIDKSEILGAELSVTYMPTNYLSLYFGGNWMDTEIKKNSVRPETDGNEIPYAPEYTLNASAELVIPAKQDWDFTLRADWAMTGPTWFHTVQGLSPTLNGVPSDMSKSRRDSYQTLDLRAGFQNDKWRITAYWQNALNEKYPREVIPAPEFGGAFVFPNNDRRLFGVELAMSL